MLRSRAGRRRITSLRGRVGTGDPSVRSCRAALQGGLSSDVAYPGPPPFGRTQVLEQAIPVYERHWSGEVSGPAWPRALSLCVRDGRGRLHISRAAVFDVAAASAADPTPENCERTMVAVAAWGAGTRWYSVVRSRRPWRSDHGRFPTIVGERLCSAVHVLTASPREMPSLSVRCNSVRNSSNAAAVSGLWPRMAAMRVSWLAAILATSRAQSSQ